MMARSTRVAAGVAVALLAATPLAPAGAQTPAHDRAAAARAELRVNQHGWLPREHKVATLIARTRHDRRGDPGRRRPAQPLGPAHHSPMTHEEDR